MSVIDDYLSNLAPAQRDELDRIRRIVKELVPDAVDAISYGMPTLKLDGKSLIHFAAFKNHMSIFPGTIRFTPDTPVAESVIRDIVETRLTELA